MVSILPAVLTILVCRSSRRRGYQASGHQFVVALAAKNRAWATEIRIGGNGGQNMGVMNKSAWRWL